MLYLACGNHGLAHEYLLAVDKSVLTLDCISALGEVTKYLVYNARGLRWITTDKFS